MNAKMMAGLLVGFVAFSMTTLPLYADPDPLSNGEEKVAGKIVDQFTDFAGDDAGTVIEALRTGESLSYIIQVEVPVLDELTGEPVLVDDGTGNLIPLVELVDQEVVVENTAGPLGFGNVTLAMALAEATLPEGASLQDIVTALFNADTTSGILDMRAAGMGWGDIYHAYGFKVGPIVSAKHFSRPDKPEVAMRGRRPDKPEKPVKVFKVERPQKPEKPVKPAKIEKPARPNRA